MWVCRQAQSRSGNSDTTMAEAQSRPSPTAAALSRDFGGEDVIDDDQRVLDATNKLRAAAAGQKVFADPTLGRGEKLCWAVKEEDHERRK